jgi:hypothetical protein
MHDTVIPSSDDLVYTFITLRICPLQRRTHNGCQDPNRMTTFDLEKPEVMKQVKAIVQTHMEPD